LNLWQDLEQEKARFSLKLKSLRQKARLNENVIKHYESLIKGIEKNIEKLLKRLPKLEDEELKDNKKLLKSISGIGEKTSLLLLVATNHLRFWTSEIGQQIFWSRTKNVPFWQQKNHDWQMQNYKGTYS
jgi:septal ring factor EnvC (AmiA/AmiB activator)